MPSIRRIHPAILLTLLASPLIAGCAMSDVSAGPSLERRPVERQLPVVVAQPASPALPPEVNATVQEAVAGLTADARRGDVAFQAALAENRATVLAGIGAADGSEDWARANVALSRIDVARGPTMLALAELDRLTLERLDAGAQGDAELLAGAQAQVAALAEAQTAAMSSIMP